MRVPGMKPTLHVANTYSALSRHAAHAAQRLHLSCFDEEGAGALTARQLEGYIAALAPQLPGLAELGALYPAGDRSPSPGAADAAPRRGVSGLAELGTLPPAGDGSPSPKAAHAVPREGVSWPGSAGDAALDERLRQPQDAGVLGAAAGEPPGAAPGAAGVPQGAEAAPAGRPGQAGGAGDGAHGGNNNRRRCGFREGWRLRKGAGCRAGRVRGVRSAQADVPACAAGQARTSAPPHLSGTECPSCQQSHEPSPLLIKNGY